MDVKFAKFKFGKGWKHLAGFFLRGSRVGFVRSEGKTARFGMSSARDGAGVFGRGASSNRLAPDVLRRWGMLISSVILLSSCATPVQQRWTNFKAYYNTYYNAKTFYEAGLSKDKSTTVVQGTANIRIYPPPGKAGMEDFRKAIDKGANVLRDHEESDFVDQALFLIGKSYFQRSEFFSATQKFEELLQVAKDPELQESAVFWLSRTMFEMELHEDAVNRTQEEISIRTQWDPMRLAEVELILAEHHIRLGQLEDAIALLDKGLPFIDDKDVRIRGNFLLAQLFEDQGEFEEAVVAYERVVRGKGDYAMIYQALRNQAIAYRELGEYRRSEQILRKMIKDDKNISSVDELGLEQALTIQASGDVDRALVLHYEFLARPVRSQDRVSTARTYYAIAEIAHFEKQDFSVAATYYDSAASLRIPAEQLPEGFDAENRAKSFGEFASLKGQIAEMDSLLTLGRMEDQERDSVIESIREQRRIELAEQLKAQRQQQNTLTVVDAQTVQQGTNDQYGFLNHLNQAMVESSRSQFKALWGDRPLVDQWRRREAVLAMSRRTDVVATAQSPAQGPEGAVEGAAGALAVGEDEPVAGDAIDGQGSLDAAGLPGFSEGAEDPSNSGTPSDSGELLGAGGVAGNAGNIAQQVGIATGVSVKQREIRRLTGKSEDPQLRIDVSKIPVDSVTQREMQDQVQLKTLQMANVIYLSMGMSDYAESYYQQVVDIGSDLLLKAQALYILSRISEAKGELDVARTLAESVVNEYPGTMYSDRLNDQYGWGGSGVEGLAVTDTVLFNGFHRDSLLIAIQDGRISESEFEDVKLMLAVAEGLKEWVRVEEDAGRLPMGGEGVGTGVGGGASGAGINGGVAGGGASVTGTGALNGSPAEQKAPLLLFESAKRYMTAARIIEQLNPGFPYQGALWDSSRVILTEIEQKYPSHDIVKRTKTILSEIALKEEPEIEKADDQDVPAESSNQTGAESPTGVVNPSGAATSTGAESPASNSSNDDSSPSSEAGTSPNQAGAPSSNDASPKNSDVERGGGSNLF